MDFAGRENLGLILTLQKQKTQLQLSVTMDFAGRENLGLILT